MDNQDLHKTLKKVARKSKLKKEADKFKQFLSISGLSQTQAAEMCYLTPRAISYYLSGERPVPRWLPELIALKLANPREVLPLSPIDERTSACLRL